MKLAIHLDLQGGGRDRDGAEWVRDGDANNRNAHHWVLAPH